LTLQNSKQTEGMTITEV